MASENFSLQVILYIFIGGGCGSLLRYLVGYGATHLLGRPSPWVTLSINLIGSLLIGLLIGMMLSSTRLSTAYRPLLVIGFCGGLTTFSTFSIEVLHYLRSGELLTAFSYLLLSLFGGLLLAYLGLRWGQTL